jgi:hypothetical protein
MNPFNTNPNAFNSSIQQIKSSVHAFTTSGVPKSARNHKQLKRSLISNVTNAIEQIETDDFGIRIVIIKTKD